MRLKQHITESFDLKKYIGDEEIETLITTNCKQYLRLLSGKEPFYRGMSESNNFGIKNVRKDRVPRGMSPQEADFLNKWLQSHGHARRDQSVMCTTNIDNLELFGREFLIFPIDPIKKYTWFQSPDMNLDGDFGWTFRTITSWFNKKSRKPGGLSDYDIETLEKLEMPFDLFFVTNKRIEVPHNNGYEVWFDCNKYYYLAA